MKERERERQGEGEKHTATGSGKPVEVLFDVVSKCLDAMREKKASTFRFFFVAGTEHPISVPLLVFLVYLFVLT